MNKKFLALSIAAVLGFGADALACSCLGIANPQQAAQTPGMRVAKVTTKSINGSEGVLIIEEMIKGEPVAKEIVVEGQDGANCASEILPESEKTWIAIFSEYEGYYTMAGCANASLPINEETGLVSILLSESVEVSEQELTKLVRVEAIPSVKNVACNVYVDRNYVSFDGSKGLIEDLQFWETIYAPAATPLALNFVKDFSAEGLTNKLEVKSTVTATANPKEYSMQTYLSEPFFGQFLSSNDLLDITQRVSTGPLDISAYKDIKGNDMNGNNPNNDPFYAYGANLDCLIQLGLPIVNL